MALMHEVMAAIARERGYQERKWGRKEHGIAAWLLIARGELGEAERSWLKDGEQADRNALMEMVQVAAVLVAGLEQHGIAERPACIAAAAHPDPTLTIQLPHGLTHEEQDRIRTHVMELMVDLRNGGPASQRPAPTNLLALAEQEAADLDGLTRVQLAARLHEAMRLRDEARAARDRLSAELVEMRTRAEHAEATGAHAQREAETAREQRDRARQLAEATPDEARAELRRRIADACRERDEVRHQVKVQNGLLTSIPALRVVLSRVWDIQPPADVCPVLVATNLLRVLHSRRSTLVDTLRALESFHREVMSDEWHGDAVDAESQKALLVAGILKVARAMARAIPDRVHAGDPCSSLAEPLPSDLMPEPPRRVAVDPPNPIGQRGSQM